MYKVDGKKTANLRNMRTHIRNTHVYTLSNDYIIKNVTVYKVKMKSENFLKKEFTILHPALCRV